MADQKYFGDHSAYTILRFFFDQLGIQYDAELEQVIKDAMVAGYGPDQIDLIMPHLENTQAFKTRFPGYHKRISNGYNAISIGQYLELENAYHRTLQEAGLPAGFYDDPADFGNWIANNVSVEEVSTRVQVATNLAQQLDPTMRQLMGQFYGLGTGDIAAYFLDQKRALPVIERQFKTAQIATAAARSGLSVTGPQRFEDLLDRGVTAEAAAANYSTVRQLRDTVGQVASIYGQTFDQTDAEEDVFFNDNQKRRQILAQEVGTFSGQSRGATGSAQRQSY